MAIFDAIAQEYDDWYKTKMGDFVDKVETDLAFGMFKPTPGQTVLDVGCGTGNFSVKLAKLGCSVTGVDLSDEMLEKAVQKIQELKLDVRVQKMDVYQLDFPDDAFDAVFSMAAFEFIKEPERAYREMYRVLKPGGQLLIGTIHREGSWGDMYLAKAAQGHFLFKHACFKTLAELENLDRDHLIQSGECLFVPPNAKEDEINLAKEQENAKHERGGFICALWRKEG